ncbi:MAG: type II secretion system protein GspL [Gammaproteobacteria bacterium]|nr:type II secretion system protein GspL [Gammaproteobacteria bacterium]
MARQLFIRLERTGTVEPVSDDAEQLSLPAYRASWLVLDNGRPLGNIMRGDLSTAVPLANNAQIVVTIPGEDILLLDIAMPGRNLQRLRNAVPYAVEDQLVDDVDSLHFSLSQQTVEGKYTVAVIDRENMRGWSKVLEKAGLQAHSIIPDALALPYKEKTWSVFVDEDRLLVRTGRYSGFASSAMNLELLLKAAINEASNKPDVINLILQSGDERDYPESITDIPLVKETYEQETLALLACDYDQQSSINLLQGDYSRRENISKHVRPWYQAAALLLVWLVWQGSVNFYQGFHLQTESKALNNQMTQLYRKTFPGSRKVVDAPAQMRQKLKELRKQSGKSQTSLQEMLAAAAPALSATDGLVLNTLRYNNGRMDLEFDVKDLQTLEALKQRLVKNSDWKVDIQSASSRKDKVETRMQIRSKGS